ncbi:DUF305 domain-containing protein [Candidatus Woesearchaeota archaeon]|nr:DUF305 domain-containing protein [Candidatus Woesearchaeota archaeon]
MDRKYNRFFVMLLISFVVMYMAMFLNVVALGHVYLSLTRFYMALLMVAPMAIVMLIAMWGMYKNKKTNTIILTVAIVVFVVALVFLRTQTPIGDEQYMKAMISHHSSAILTSEEAAITDPEVRELADQIIATQKEEIAQMQEILERLES